MKSRRSLRSDIVIINSVVVVIILFAQFFYFAYLSNLMTEQKKNDVDNLLLQINNKIEDCTSISKYMQNYILSNTNVREFLTSTDNKEKEQLFSECAQDVRSESGIYADRLSVIIQGLDGKVYYILNEPDANQKTKIEAVLPPIEKITETGIDFYGITDRSYKNIYICSYLPITMYNTKVVGKDYVGRVIVIDKFNVREIAYENGFFSGIKIEFISKGDIAPIKAEIGFTEGNNHIFSERSTLENSWKICAEVDEKTIKDSIGLNHQRGIIIVEIIIVVVSILIMAILLNKTIAVPAKRILSFLDKYRLNCKGQRLSHFNSEEFDSIAQHINKMLEKNENMARDIVSNQQKLYEKELSENEAKLYALQSQINPHFLYNTLDCMSSIAIANGQDDIYKITIGLAEILRYSLVSDINVILEDEIAIVEKYLAIQQIRFGNRVEVDIDIDDDIWEVGVIRMSLQPIVENIFKYGMDKKKTNIIIKGYKDEGKAIISIKDNGSGITNEVYEQLIDKLSGESEMYSKEGKNGLVNINRRLKFKYGNEYGLTINQKAGEFFEVIMAIPM